MVKLKNLIRRISVLPFQKQPFVDTIEKSLRMLQFVNKETQSLLLTFRRFHILF